MRTRSSTGFNKIPENVAAVVFSHLGGDPTDRIRLSAVSKVWRDAEKADASLPGTPRALLDDTHTILVHMLLDDTHTILVHSTKKRLYWLRKAADRGDAVAMNEIGYCYRFGYGVNRDYTKAKEWWERASGCGHADATCRLASCYRYGDGVEKNEAKAVEIYVKATELGSGGAAHALGRIYELRSCGVAENKTEALKWYRLAAERGVSDARVSVDRLELELAAA
tara:strand:- start:834 stop:1505 length:672 start_codon:yes stop_codon:yes gene_type:complete